VLVHCASSRDGSALGAYLERLLHFDKTAAVRLVGVGPAAAAYGGPPFGGRTVLAVRLVALCAQTAPFDVTVLAGKLLEGLSRDETELLVPDTMVGGPSWAGLLPPRTGWTRLGLVSVRELALEAARGNADFRFRALGLDRAALDALGEEIWSRPVEASRDAGAGAGTDTESGAVTAGTGAAGTESGAAETLAVSADAGAAQTTAQTPAQVETPAQMQNPMQASAQIPAQGTATAPLALRTAHAAQALGFLGPDPEQSAEWAPLARIGRWLRLDAPYGTVLQRD
jgi:hypothetical protein